MDWVRLQHLIPAILKLDVEAIREAAGDEELTASAVIVVAIAGVASAIGTLHIFPGILTNPIMTVVGSFIGVGILFLLAKLFGGTGNFLSYYRPLGLAYALQWVAVIPVAGSFLAMITGIWMTVVAIVVTREVHGFSTGKAALVVLIPVILLMILVMMLVGLLGLAAIQAGFSGS